MRACDVEGRPHGFQDRSGSVRLPPSAGLFQASNDGGLLRDALLRLLDVAVGQGDNILWLVHGAPGWPEPRPNAGTAANDRAP
jgi:hypothetical protein